MPVPVCSHCATIFLEPREHYRHVETFENLLESTKTCYMCALLLNSIPDETFRQILEQIGAGSYARLAVLGSAESSEETNGPWIRKCLEINTCKNSFLGEGFALMTQKSDHRAIWSTQGPIVFDERAAVIHEWIEQCSLRHKLCRSPSACYLPTRLIKVGDSSTSILYLESSHKIVQSRDIPTYAALSHRWGETKPSLMLTKANLQQFHDGFNLQALPKTFLDAVRITQRLGIPYLWIDSLSIIQDDQDDWQKEASMMASVYRNAHITIANASSDDSNGGCSIDGSLRSMNHKLEVQTPDGSLQQFSIRSPLRRPDMLKGSSLFDRGWILQEQILSRRTVYFTKDQMVWQCHKTRLMEDGITGTTQAPTRELAEYDFRMLDSLSGMWWKWMKNYCSRQLTNPADRLAALAGITQLYQEETGDTPLLGLWKSTIVQDLLWYREETAETLIVSSMPSHKFPSWSWASLDGVPLGIPEGLSLYPSYPDVKYVSHDIIWSKEPLTSTLIKARITLRGQILEMKDQLHLQNLETRCSLDDHYGNRHIGPLMRRLSGHMVKEHYLAPDGSYFSGEVAREIQTGSSTTQARTHSVDNCSLRVVHGSSKLQLDRKIEPGTKIFGLFMGTSWQKEEVTLLLTPVDDGLFRRLGIAFHSHVEMPRAYCSRHGWQLKDFAPGDACRKSCTTVEIVDHHTIRCFQDIEPQTITLV